VRIPPVVSIVFAGSLLVAGAGVTFAQDEQTPKVVTRIRRECVASRAIAAIGYSKRLQILDIEFLNGAIYRYEEVPRSVYHELMEADSKAHYFHQHIKGRFKSSRIRRWETKGVAQ
jgi:KTSC domain